jgi:glycine rich protein
LAIDNAAQRAAKALVSGLITPLEKRIQRLERGSNTAQLKYSTIDNGSLTVTDSDGVVRQIIGVQPDGSITSQDHNGPAPSVPTAPIVTLVQLGLTISWDGANADGSALAADFDHVEIHVSDTDGFTPDVTTLQSTLLKSGSFTVTPLDETVHYAVLVAVNRSKVSSDPSAQASGTPLPVVASGVADGSITAAMLADEAVTNAKIAGNAVDGTKLADGSVSASKIVAGAVGSSALAPGAVDASALEDGSVSASKIVAGAVDSTSLADGAVIAGKVAAGVIGADELAANSVIAGKISAGAVGADELAANSVVAGKIAADAVDANAIVAGAIDTSKLAADAVEADNIAANAVTAGKIDAGAVSADNLSANAVTADKIAAGAIDGSIINAPIINGGEISAADFILEPGSNNAVLTYGTPPPTTITVSVAGSGTWECPAGVTSIHVECWGGGGGGGGGTRFSGTSYSGSGGGGGGEYASENALAVTPGHIYSYTVGAGGAGGVGSSPPATTSDGRPGGTTIFAGDSVTVTAHGGAGGLDFPISGGSGGNGGTGSTNSVNHPGGAGGGNPPLEGYPNGGGGGSSGGPTSAGNAGAACTNLVGGVGGPAVSFGGAGGKGDDHGTGAMQGGLPGGGGGGGEAFSTTVLDAGAAGGTGQIRITFQVASGTPQLLATVSAESGTDDYGSHYPAGVASVNAFGGDYASLLQTSTPNSALVFGELGSTYDVDLYRYNDGANLWLRTSTRLKVDHQLTVGGQLTATGGTAANPTIITTDSWHGLGAASGWSKSGNGVGSGTNGFYYRIVADSNEVEIAFDLKYNGTSTGGPSTMIASGAIPSAYRPAVLVNLPSCAAYSVPPVSGNNAAFPRVNTDGSVQIVNEVVSSMIYAGVYRYPLGTFP